jgi:hypothetical protein
MIKNNKGAMEMSVGTIVTIVLLVSVLVLGLILIRSIFDVGINAVDMTEDQIGNEMKKIFTEEKKLVIYPGTTEIEMKRGETWGVGLGVANRLKGDVRNQQFSYEVYVDDPDVRDNCGLNSNEVEEWIKGREGIDIPMPVGNDISVEKVLFEVPETAPLCSVKIRVQVKVDKANYASESFFMTIV